MNDVIAALMAWTVAHSGYPAPHDLPAIEYLPTAAFIQQVCPNRAQCTVLGYYEDGTRTIVLHEALQELKERRARAMLVHEIVHYLQDNSGRWGAKTCQTWIEREREAYRVQLLYLVENGIPPSYLMMPQFNLAQCEASQPPHA